MPASGWEMADELSGLIALHDASNIAAVIVEPVAGSAGVIPPPAGYLQRLRDICTANDILLIFDEVITGLGRCGGMTAADVFGVVPDIMIMAKQLTEGFGKRILLNPKGKETVYSPEELKGRIVLKGYPGSVGPEPEEEEPSSQESEDEPRLLADDAAAPLQVGAHLVVMQQLLVRLHQVAVTAAVLEAPRE